MGRQGWSGRTGFGQGVWCFFLVFLGEGMAAYL
jgi:hypothetical protein